MRLWADVYDAAGIKQGDGPVWALTGATITRALDGAGSVTVSAPGSEARAIELLTNERRIRVYGYAPSNAPAGAGASGRELGRGIIRDVQARANPSGWDLRADGPDMLDELKRRSVLLGKIYSGQTLAQIVSDLAALAGWTASIDAAYVGKLVQARFDGVSALKALQEIAKGQGLHLREGLAEKSIEIGAFGVATGVRLMGAAYVPVELQSNDDVMLIDSITISRASEQIVNWLVPVGAGEGESAITLAKSTRTLPYPIVPVVANGKTLYALADAGSIAAYGRIEKVGAFKDVAPISNSAADLAMAANALYDVAAAWLKRNSQRIDTYRVSVVKVRRTVRPGDTVRLIYKGLIETETGLLTFMDVDADFYVIRVTERVGLEGTSLDLEISNADQVTQDAAQIIVGAIDQIMMAGLRVQPYPSQGTYVYRKEIDSPHPAIVPIDITNAVLILNQCRLLMKTRPFRVTAKAAAAGTVTTGSSGGATPTSSGGGALVTSTTATSHDHLVMRANDGTSWGALTLATFTVFEQETGTLFHFQAQADAGAGARLLGMQSGGSHVHDIDIPAHTHTVSIPAHTHTIPVLLVEFGIEDDTQYPSSVRMEINGVDVTAALGGPWATAGQAIDVTVDITSYLVNASGGLQQRHQVTLSCLGGRGEIEVTVELSTTVQSILVG